MGALSNSGRKSANYAGLYKGIQSAAAAIWWDLDARKVPVNTVRCNRKSLSSRFALTIPEASSNNWHSN
jgi:hypothetical protein